MGRLIGSLFLFLIFIIPLFSGVGSVYASSNYWKGKGIWDTYGKIQSFNYVRHDVNGFSATMWLNQRPEYESSESNQDNVAQLTGLSACTDARYSKKSDSTWSSWQRKTYGYYSFATTMATTATETTCVSDDDYYTSGCVISDLASSYALHSESQNLCDSCLETKTFWGSKISDSWDTSRCEDGGLNACPLSASGDTMCMLKSTNERHFVGDCCTYDWDYIKSQQPSLDTAPRTVWGKKYYNNAVSGSTNFLASAIKWKADAALDGNCGLSRVCSLIPARSTTGTAIDTTAEEVIPGDGPVAFKLSLTQSKGNYSVSCTYTEKASKTFDTPRSSKVSEQDYELTTGCKDAANGISSIDMGICANIGEDAGSATNNVYVCCTSDAKTSDNALALESTSTSYGCCSSKCWDGSSKSCSDTGVAHSVYSSYVCFGSEWKKCTSAEVGQCITSDGATVSNPTPKSGCYKVCSVVRDTTTGIADYFWRDYAGYSGLSATAKPVKLVGERSAVSDYCDTRVDSSSISPFKVSGANDCGTFTMGTGTSTKTYYDSGCANGTSQQGYCEEAASNEPSDLGGSLCDSGELLVDYYFVEPNLGSRVSSKSDGALDTCVVPDASYQQLMCDSDGVVVTKKDSSGNPIYDNVENEIYSNYPLDNEWACNPAIVVDDIKFTQRDENQASSDDKYYFKISDENDPVNVPVTMKLSVSSDTVSSVEASKVKMYCQLGDGASSNTQKTFVLGTDQRILSSSSLFGDSYGTDPQISSNSFGDYGKTCSSWTDRDWYCVPALELNGVSKDYLLSKTGIDLTPFILSTSSTTDNVKTDLWDDGEQKPYLASMVDYAIISFDDIDTSLHMCKGGVCEKNSKVPDSCTDTGCDLEERAADSSVTYGDEEGWFNTEFVIGVDNCNSKNNPSYSISCDVYKGVDDNSPLATSVVEYYGFAEGTSVDRTILSSTFGKNTNVLVSVSAPKFTSSGSDENGICDSSDGRIPFKDCTYSVKCTITDSLTGFSKDIVLKNQKLEDTGGDFSCSKPTHCLSLLCDTSESKCEAADDACSMDWQGTYNADTGKFTCVSGYFYEDNYCNDINCVEYGIDVSGCGADGCGFCLDGTDGSGNCELGCTPYGGSSFCDGRLPGIDFTAKTSSKTSTYWAPGCSELCEYTCDGNPSSVCDWNYGERFDMKYKTEDGEAPHSSGFLDLVCTDCCDMECDLVSSDANDGETALGNPVNTYPGEPDFVESSYSCGTPKKLSRLTPYSDEYRYCKEACMDINIYNDPGETYGMKSNYPDNYDFSSYGITFSPKCYDEVSDGALCTPWCITRTEELDRWRSDLNKESEFMIFWGKTSREAKNYCSDFNNWLDKSYSGDGTHRISPARTDVALYPQSPMFSACGLVNLNDYTASGDQGGPATSSVEDDWPDSEEMTELEAETDGGASYVVGLALPFDPHCGESDVSECELTFSKKTDDASLPTTVGLTMDGTSKTVSLPISSSDVLKVSDVDLTNEYMQGNGPRDIWIICTSNRNPILFTPKYSQTVDEELPQAVDADFNFRGWKYDDAEGTWGLADYSISELNPAHDHLELGYRTKKMDSISAADLPDNNGVSLRELASKSCGDGSQLNCPDGASNCGCGVLNSCYSDADCTAGKGCPDEWSCSSSHVCTYSGMYGNKIQTSIYNYDEDVILASDMISGWQCFGPKANPPMPCRSSAVSSFDGTSGTGPRPCDIVNVGIRVEDTVENPSLSGCNIWNFTLGTGAFSQSYTIHVSTDKKTSTDTPDYSYFFDASNSKFWLPVGPTQNRVVVELSLECIEPGKTAAPLYDFFEFSVGNSASGVPVYTCPNHDPTHESNTLGYEYGSYCRPNEDGDCSSANKQVCFEKDDITESSEPFLYPNKFPIYQCMDQCGENPTGTVLCQWGREDLLTCADDCCNEIDGVRDGTAVSRIDPLDSNSPLIDWSFMDEKYGVVSKYDNAQDRCYQSCKGSAISKNLEPTMHYTRMEYFPGQDIYSCDGAYKTTEMCDDFCEPTCGNSICEPEYGEVTYNNATDEYSILCIDDCCNVNAGTSIVPNSNNLNVVDNPRVRCVGNDCFICQVNSTDTVCGSTPFTTYDKGLCWNQCNVFGGKDSCDGVFPEDEFGAIPYSTSDCDTTCNKKEPSVTIKFFEKDNPNQDCETWQGGYDSIDELPPCKTYDVGVYAEQPLNCKTSDDEYCEVLINGDRYVLNSTAFRPAVVTEPTANYACKGYNGKGQLVPFEASFASTPQEGKNYLWDVSIKDTDGSIQSSKIPFTVRDSSVTDSALCHEDEYCESNSDCEADFYCNSVVNLCKPICGEVEGAEYYQCGLPNSPSYCEDTSKLPQIGICEPEYGESIYNDCSINLKNIGIFQDKKRGDCCNSSGVVSEGFSDLTLVGKCKEECGADLECDLRYPNDFVIDELTGEVVYKCNSMCKKTDDKLVLDVSAIDSVGNLILDSSKGSSTGSIEQTLGRRITFVPSVAASSKDISTSGSELTIWANNILEPIYDGPVKSSYEFETMSEIFSKGDNYLFFKVTHPNLISDSQNVTLNLYRTMKLDASVADDSSNVVDCFYKTGDSRKGCGSREVYVTPSVSDLATGMDISVDVNCTLEDETISGKSGEVLVLTVPTDSSVGIKSLSCTATAENYQAAHKSVSVRVLGEISDVLAEVPALISPGETYRISPLRVTDNSGVQLQDYDWVWSLGDERFCYNVENCQVPKSSYIGYNPILLTTYANYYDPFVSEFNVTIKPIKSYQVSISPSSKFVSQQGGETSYQIFVNNTGNTDVDVSFELVKRLLSSVDIQDEYDNRDSGLTDDEKLSKEIATVISELNQTTQSDLAIELGFSETATPAELAEHLVTIVGGDLESFTYESSTLTEPTYYALRQGLEDKFLSEGASNSQLLSDFATNNFETVPWYRFASSSVTARAGENIRNFLYFDVPSGQDLQQIDFSLVYLDQYGEISHIPGSLKITDQKIYEFELTPEVLPTKSIVLGENEDYGLSLSNTGTMDDEYGFRLTGTGANYITVPMTLQVPATGDTSAKVPLTISGTNRGSYDFGVCAQSANNITGEHCSVGDFIVSVADLALLAPSNLSANIGDDVNFTVTVATGDIATDVDLTVDAPSIIEDSLSLKNEPLSLGANSEVERTVSFKPTHDGNFTIHLKAASTKIPTLVKSWDIELEVLPPQEVITFRSNYLQVRQMLNDLNQLTEKVADTGVDVVLSRQLASDASDILDEADALIAAGKYAEATAKMNKARDLLKDAIKYAELPAVSEAPSGRMSLATGIMAILAIIAVLGAIAYAATKGLIPGMGK